MFEQRGNTLFCVFGRKSIAYGLSQKVAGAIQVQLRDGTGHTPTDGMLAPEVYGKLPVRAAFHFTDIQQIDGLIGCLERARNVMKGD